MTVSPPPYYSHRERVNSLVAQTVKNRPAMQKTRVWSLGWEDPLEKEMATHSSILASRIPWTEEPGRLPSTGLQRVEYNWATKPAQHVLSSYPSIHPSSCLWVGHNWATNIFTTLSRSPSQKGAGGLQGLSSWPLQGPLAQTLPVPLLVEGPPWLPLPSPSLRVKVFHSTVFRAFLQLHHPSLLLVTYSSVPSL